MKHPQTIAVVGILLSGILLCGAREPMEGREILRDLREFNREHREPRASEPRETPEPRENRDHRDRSPQGVFGTFLKAVAPADIAIPISEVPDNPDYQHAVERDRKMGREIQKRHAAPKPTPTSEPWDQLRGGIR